MEFHLSVADDPAPWTATWRIGKQDGEVLATRTLRLCGQNPDVYPLPPDGQAADPGAASLWCTGKAEDLRTVLRNVMIRQPGPDGIAKLGRYLFDVLLGHDPVLEKTLWDAMSTRAKEAGERRIELSLAFSRSQGALARLPWEMMRSQASFLAAEAGVTIVRRVPGVSHTAEISMPPLVLFAVGTAVDDDAIGAVAEFNSVLRAILTGGASRVLRTRLLLSVSPQQLAAAIRRHRPDVVHVIAHGDVDKGGCYLELQNENGDPVPVYSEGLATILQPDPAVRFPPVVVLTACHTGGTDYYAKFQEFALPMAADLVTRGVPVVVGMAGRVRDQACRLFSRRFYELLCDDGDVAAAAAGGRRAAIAGGGSSPDHASDWAMPTLFVSSRVSLAVPAADRSVADKWFSALGAFRKGERHPFCDRVGLMESFSVLMDDFADQPAAGRGWDDVQVLCIADGLPEGSKTGRTWLLREMAQKAICNGHVPCLVRYQDEGKDTPVDMRTLLQTINGAILRTRSRFKLESDPPASMVAGLLELPPDAPVPADLPADVRQVSANRKAGSPDVLAAALRHDLEALLKEVADLRPPWMTSPARLVLMLDDLHEYDLPAVNALIDHVSGDMGLRKASRSVRVVVCYAQSAKHPDVTKAIADWGSSKIVHLAQFEPPVRGALEQYLLGYHDHLNKHTPLAVVDGHPRTEPFLDSLAEEIEGVPTYLDSRGRDFVGAHWRTERKLTSDAFLVEVDDDDALAKQRLDRT